jgi:hypothetical protein
MDKLPIVSKHVNGWCGKGATVLSGDRRFRAVRPFVFRWERRYSGWSRHSSRWPYRAKWSTSSSTRFLPEPFTRVLGLTPASKLAPANQTTWVRFFGAKHTRISSLFVRPLVFENGRLPSTGSDAVRGWPEPPRGSMLWQPGCARQSATEVGEAALGPGVLVRGSSGIVWGVFV